MGAECPPPCWNTLLCGQHRRAFSWKIIRQERGKVSFTDTLSYFCTDIRPLPFGTVLIVQRHEIDTAQDLGQPAAALQQALGLPRHLAFLQVIEELGSPLPLCLTYGLKNAGLGHAVEIGIHRRLPARLDHVEINGLPHDIRLRHAPGQTTCRDACPVRVHLLVQRVDAEAEAMGQQGQPTALVEDTQVIPECRIIAKRQIRFPFRVTLVDQLCHHAVLQIGRLRRHVDVTH